MKKTRDTPRGDPEKWGGGESCASLASPYAQHTPLALSADM